MSNVHVTDDGRIRPCRATIKPCRYLNAVDGNRHFSSAEEAEAKAAELSGATKVIGSHKRTPGGKKRVKTYGTVNRAAHSVDMADSSLANRAARFAPVPEVMGGVEFDDFSSLARADRDEMNPTDNRFNYLYA